MNQKVLSKFTCPYSDVPIYIDLNSINGIFTLNSGTNHFYSINRPDNGQAYMGTVTVLIMGPGQNVVHVKEHLSEVIALTEGRDPNPAKILFGGSK